jgi:hypothetical protein
MRDSIHGVWRCAALLIVVAACASEPVSPVGGLSRGASMAKPSSGTPVTVTVVPTSPGLHPTPDNTYSVTIPNGGFLDVRPACSSTDRLGLQGMNAAFDALGARSTCNGGNLSGFMFLRPLVNLSSAVDAACADQDVPQQTSNAWNFGVTSRYFFQVDGPDADSKYDDQQYTLVLTDCWVHSVPGEPNARRVTASVGDLYAGQTGTPIAGFSGITVNVDLTFRP